VGTGIGVTPGGRSLPSPPNVHGDSTPDSNPPLTMAFGTSVAVTVCVINKVVAWNFSILSLKPELTVSEVTFRGNVRVNTSQ
jgi:hypothetical protein